MNKIIINGAATDSLILIGESIKNLAHHIPEGKIVVITDANVNRLYNTLFHQYPVIEIQAGEEQKTLETANYLYGQLIALEADRATFIVGIGGGVVCDIAGFVASTYMRGLDFGFVATSLLAQVDASVGGKNGVNFRRFKNMVGTFNQPEFVICDIDLLKTLPENEIRCGLGEIVKHAIIADEELFALLEEHSDKILALDKELVEKVVTDSLLIKSDIVNRDEREANERRLLNFGHTVGHAVEKATGLTHGEALGVGITAASKLSKKRGLLSHADYQRIIALLKKLHLPTETEVSDEELVQAIRLDKKREGEALNMVLITKIGHALVEKISLDELEEAIK